MVLSLERLFDSPGAEIPFEHTLDSSRFPEMSALPFGSSVRIKGIVRNLAGVVTVEYTADYMLDTVCDRCLDPVQRPRHIQANHVAVRALSGDGGDEDYLILPEGELDIDEMAYSDLVLDLPGKVLCSPDCKGLCPQCGANWNHETCACTGKAVDPRLRVLERLLEEQEP